MQFSKWDNSLAVRLPATVVEALDLKEGLNRNFMAGKREFKVARDQSRYSRRLTPSAWLKRSGLLKDRVRGSSPLAQNSFHGWTQTRSEQRF